MPLVIDTSHQAESFNNRELLLVLHYTAENFDRSLELLTKGPVSSHYLVPETAINGQRKVYQLVPENKRAWHAGVSGWQNRTNLNDSSIGIEIVNLGFIDKGGESSWYNFPEYQIELVGDVCKDIINRHGINPTRIVGHGDIAPGRKVDPGPLFPWKTLHDNGIGAWYDEDEKNIVQEIIQYKNKPLDINWIQKILRMYGYPINETGESDEQTACVIKAFQMHFRPTDYSGNPDPETCAILQSLVSKYYPEQATEIL